jgi:hypothetical protein
MRRDFILPILLFVTLMAMATYATTGARQGAAELSTVPALCDASGRLGRLPHLTEASGLAASARHRGIFWTHNDSADPTLYAIKADGVVSGHVRVAGASVIDWEAVAVGRCPGGTCVFVGDIGDNEMKRRTITVYRTPEPAPADSATGPVEALEAVYPEGPQDAESLFVVGETLFIVTKGEKTPVRVYRFPSAQPAGPITLELVATLSSSERDKRARVTDAAVSPDARWIALRTNDHVLFRKTSTLLAGKAEIPLAFDLRALREPQGEAITWADNHTLLLAGEAEGGGTLGRMSCSLPPS